MMSLALVMLPVATTPSRMGLPPIVYAGAAALKLIPSNSVLGAKSLPSEVEVEASKNSTSPGMGVYAAFAPVLQLAVFQKLLEGVAFHVALAAEAQCVQPAVTDTAA